MYVIKAFVDGKEYQIHNLKFKSLIVCDPYFEIGDNINGKAEFKVYPDHPYYSKVKKLTTEIVFLNDGVEEFCGRVLYDDENSAGIKEVFVEGELAYFCDSIQRPKVYHNYSVREYLQDIIDNHNAQVEERKRFTLGRVSVTDPNDSLYRYSNWENTREILKDKLTNRLGGHLVIRKENGIRYLDYLSDEDFFVNSDQQIRFGKNLLDFAKNIDASDIATCIIPLGEKLEQDEQNEELQEQRLTIESVNGGIDYVTDDNAVAEYGKIQKTIIFDDVTLPENLKKKGEEYLHSVQFENMVLTVKAIDMGLLQKDVENLRIGNMVRCISKPNALDNWMPLEKKKVYISKFSKNTLTLGTEKVNATYTSSNRQKTASMESTIKSLPTKREILHEAMRDATDLINRRTEDGYAIHTPEEFIVADQPGAFEAKNLWRWGLGGLAHYSQGYEGPADGIALTMDGKINGEMLLAGSVVAKSIDIEYRKSVETKISNSKQESKQYSDNAIKAAKQSIETSLKTMEDRISLSVSSTKETVSKKNYVLSGEQESLDISMFDLSGEFADIEKCEFLNMNCFKLSFKNSGLQLIEQSVGELPEGDYEIQALLAFPMENTADQYRPDRIEYGFSDNRSIAALELYEAGKFHSFKKSVHITKNSKTVSIAVYGDAGDICYVTNIRCLREIQEYFDDIKSDISLLDESIKTEVIRATKGEDELRSSIVVNSNKIENKVTKGDISSLISQESGKIEISADRFKLDSTNCKISEDGSIEAKNAKITGGSMNVTASSAVQAVVSVETSAYKSETMASGVKLSNKVSGNYVLLGQQGVYYYKNNGGNSYSANSYFDLLNGVLRAPDTGSSSYIYSLTTQNLTVNGYKSRAVDTKDFGKILEYCYEMPCPVFGDIGRATVAEDGACYVYIDEAFLQTIAGTNKYHVFLQKEGEGDIWLDEKQTDYFVVKGTAGLDFSWEIKAKQKGFENTRQESAEEIEIEKEADYETIWYEEIEIEKEADYETIWYEELENYESEVTNYEY